MLFRIIFWFAIFFLIYRFLKNMFGPPTQPPRGPMHQQRGFEQEQKKAGLDLSQEDVEDIPYREVKDKPKKGS